MATSPQDVTIGELVRTVQRIEKKLDQALAEQVSLKTDLAVIKVKVAFFATAISVFVMAVIEGARAFLLR